MQQPRQQHMGFDVVGPQPPNYQPDERFEEQHASKAQQVAEPPARPGVGNFRQDPGHGTES